MPNNNNKGKKANSPRYSEKYGADRPNPYTGYLPPGAAKAGEIYHPEAIDRKKLDAMSHATAQSSRELAEKNEKILEKSDNTQNRIPARRRRELISVERKSGAKAEQEKRLEEIKNEAVADIRAQQNPIEEKNEPAKKEKTENSAIASVPQIVTMPDGRMMLASPGKDENGNSIIVLTPVLVVENQKEHEIELSNGIEMTEIPAEVPASQTAETLMHELLHEIEKSEAVLVYPEQKAKYPNGAPMFEGEIPLYPDGSPMYSESMPLYPNGAPMYMDDIPVLSNGLPVFESGEDEFAPSENVIFESVESSFEKEEPKQTQTENEIEPEAKTAVFKRIEREYPEEDQEEDDSDIKIAPAPKSKPVSSKRHAFIEQAERSLKVVSDLGRKTLRSTKSQDDTLFLRKERPEDTTAVFNLPNGVKLPAYIDDDEFLEKWLDEGEGMNINEKRHKRRVSAIIGSVTMIFALIGFIWVIKYTFGALSGIGNTDAKKLQYENFIAPVVMSEVDEFETWNTIPQSKLLQSAVFHVLLNMSESSYSTDDTNKLIIPSNDVLEAARTLYGADVELDISAYNELNSDEFYYSDTDDCFHVAATGISGPQPDVVSITKHGGEVTLVVGYLDEASIGTVTEDSYYRVLVFILGQNDDDGYFISAIRQQTESE